MSRQLKPLAKVTKQAFIHGQGEVREKFTLRSLAPTGNMLQNITSKAAVC